MRWHTSTNERRSHGRFIERETIITILFKRSQRVWRGWSTSLASFSLERTIKDVNSLQFSNENALGLWMRILNAHKLLYTIYISRREAFVQLPNSVFSAFLLLIETTDSVNQPNLSSQWSEKLLTGWTWTRCYTEECPGQFLSYCHLTFQQGPVHSSVLLTLQGPPPMATWTIPWPVWNPFFSCLLKGTREGKTAVRWKVNLSLSYPLLLLQCLSLKLRIC